MKFLFTVLFWGGVVRAMLEWLYSRRVGAPITRTEKRFVGTALLLTATSLPILVAVGTHPTVAAYVFALSIIAILHGWVLQRRIRRAGRPSV